MGLSQFHLNREIMGGYFREVPGDTLFALEFLLYDTAIGLTGASASCTLVTAAGDQITTRPTMANIATFTLRLRQIWQTGDMGVEGYFKALFHVT